MFRITRLLQIAKPLINASSSYFQQSALVYTNRVWFSQKSEDKIFQMIERGNIEQNLDKIMADITTLSEDLREEVMDAILQKIYDRRVPPRIILDDKFAIQLRRYPHLHFEAYYHRAVQSINKLEEHIDSQDKKVKMIIAKEISDSFVVCFQDLKKIQPKVAAPKQIQLLRSFAHYNFYYLSKLVDPSKEHECINKSRECYKLTLVKSAALLRSLLKEEQQLINGANPHQTLQQKQQREDELQQLDEFKYQVVEQYAQIVSEMMSVEEELFNKKQPKVQEKNNANQVEEEQIEFEMAKQTLWLETVIEKAVKNYQLIPHRMMKSKYYYKLRKIHLEVKHQIMLRELVSAKKSKERKQQILKIQQQTKEKMDSLYDDALEDMKNIQSQELEAEVFSDHIMGMMSIKLHQFFTEKGFQNQIDDKKIGEFVQKLVNNIADQNKKRQTLGLIIQKVKDTFDVKIDSYVQKVPRNLRTQRRKRVEEEGNV